MSYDGYGYGRWAPYVPVAERRRKAVQAVSKMARDGQKASPVHIEGRKIATTFWGQAWCEHLESYSDLANRLPRGRTYVRNGSVVDLQHRDGKIQALVSGSELYRVTISIKALEKARWKSVIGACAGQIDSLVELLQGKLSRSVMEVITDRKRGLFPAPSEITLACSCPDGAYMCKHVAAVLYGIGARLDQQPELLFQLRQVDQRDLIAAASTGALDQTAMNTSNVLDDDINLASMFGIELDDGDEPAPAKAKVARVKARSKAAPVKAKAVVKTQASAPRRGKTVTAKDLFAHGITYNTMQSWLRSGVLTHSGERGVYRATSQTAQRIVDATGKRWKD